MASATLAVLVGFANPSNANLPLCTVDDTGHVEHVRQADPRVGQRSGPWGGLYAIGFGDITQGYAVGIHRRPPS